MSFSVQKLVAAVFVFLLTFLVIPAAYASTLSVTQIGTATTSGKLTHFWYTGSTPVLKGTADPSGSVSITVGTISGNTTADASGNWSWQTSQAFAQGDNQVTITSASGTLSFTLTIGSTMPTGISSSTQSASPSALPVTGAVEWTIALFAAGLMAVVAGAFLFKKNSIMA